MNLPIIQSQPQSNRVWDQLVPIVQNRMHTDAYLTDGIDEPSYYNELCHILRNASKGETVNLYINTPGGIIDSAFMIVDAIKSSKAKVTAYLAGTVASAGTIISLSCDNLVVADHTAWMSHNYSGAVGGKGHEMKARQEFIDKSLRDAFYSFHAGFFTDEEIESIIEGKDMWLGKDEVLTRWENKKRFNKNNTDKNVVERISD